MTTTEASVYLKMASLKGVGPARVRQAMEAARTFPSGAEVALEAGDAKRAWSGILDAEQLAALTARQPELAMLDRLSAQGIDTLSLLDADYPGRLLATLGRSAPPLLFVRGNRALLGPPAVGFCGSRHASDKGLVTAHDISDQLARQHIVVVSGYASGVDLEAHRAALAAGGSTVIVLAEGIEHFRVKQELKESWDWERALVLSEFLPGARWSAPRAMQRNSTILGLSLAMVLIEAGATGGSYAAGEAALKLQLPLFAPVYEGMPATAVGNRLLLDRGARPLKKNASTLRARLDPVLALLSSGSTLPSKPAERQLSLLAQ